MHQGKLIRCSTPEAMKAATGSANLEGAFIQTIHAVEAVKA
jgi:ABC-type Na+ transport system ATPase subunit NatA